MLSVVQLFGHVLKVLCGNRLYSDQLILQESEGYVGDVQGFVLSPNDQLPKLVQCDQKEVHPCGHGLAPCRNSDRHIRIPKVLHETVPESFQSVERDKFPELW